MLRFESVQAMSQQLCGERAESAFLPGPGKPKRGSFGDYVSKVDQFIHKQTDEIE